LGSERELEGTATSTASAEPPGSPTVVQMHAINASESEKNRLGGKAGALTSTMNDRMASVLAAAATAAPAAVGQ